MNEIHQEIERTMSRLASRLDGAGPESAWPALEELGLTCVSLPGALGGGGGEAVDAVMVVRTAARLGLGGPVAESNLLASWLLERAGIELPPGMTTAAPDSSGLTCERTGSGWLVRGVLPRVPWGRSAEHVVAWARDADAVMAVLVPRSGRRAETATNLAGDPADTLTVEVTVAPAAAKPVQGHLDADLVRRRGALMRCVQLAGALEAVRDLTVRHVTEREQFGRPLSRFQAVQQLAAELVGEVAAAGAAVDAAVRAGEGDVWAVASAKVRAGRAADRASAIAHQLHGAIGFTDEHALHRYTTRLWSWRDDFGGEAEWSDVLGARALASEGLWPELSAGT